ncbi:MAG: sulfurtransferase [Terriglobia bacterium]
MKVVKTALTPIFLLFGSLALSASDYPNATLLIETAELAEMLGQPEVHVLDARPPEEYRQGHIPGAVNLPAPATDDVEANRQGFPLSPFLALDLFLGAGINSASRVIIYDSQGTRFAARVFYVLEFFGHQHVQILNGGFPKWQGEGRGVTAEASNAAPGDFEPQARGELIATSDWVAQHLTDANVRVIDARSPEEVSGQRGTGPRVGHIPGAVNIEWTRVLDAGGLQIILPRAELEKLFAAAEIKPEHEVVTYCQSGMRASLVYFALRLMGFPRVRVYDSSWADWSSNVALPIER